MKFRFVIFGLLSAFCTQSALAQLSEEEMAGLIIQSLVQQSLLRRSENLSQEQRAQRKAELIKKAEEVRAQMYSGKQEFLLKYGTYGMVAAAFVGQIALTASLQYMQQRGNAWSLLKEEKALGEFDFLLGEPKGYESLLNKWNTAWWTGLKVGGGSAVAAIAAACGAGWLGQKLDLQNQLKKQLNEIEQQIAELDVLDAAEVSGAA